MSASIEDMKGGESSCCGASVYTDLGICAECKEHCDIVEPEQDEIQEDTTSMEEKLETLQPDEAREDALSDAEGRI